MARHRDQSLRQTPGTEWAELATANQAFNQNSTEIQIAEIHTASPEDVDTVVQTAKYFLKHNSWKHISGTHQGMLMARLADLIDVALNEDLSETVSTICYYSGWADETFGQAKSTTSTKFAYTLRQPIVAWRLGPALECRNTVVIKAAEQTLLTIFFPPGVANLLNGYGRIAGATLVQHPLVDKAAFAGSTAIASQILKMASVGLKNITFKAGGKYPLLVFSDSDLEQVAKWSNYGIMIFVPKDTFPGLQVTKDQYDRVLSYIDIGKSDGATLLCGGKAQRGKGLFIQPTVFAYLFGPAVSISSFKTEYEAIRSQSGMGNFMTRAHFRASGLRLATGVFAGPG
ncbi:ALDH-like protein [Lojkania enalia]|uniref:ALDH-like protein n=1 Tax=Lojkania enalia TaxID=147567 RepID=A0A9P4N6T2_9PLEO|nr:ALDH-like protein [Didymosphaeria enalia]